MCKYCGINIALTLLSVSVVCLQLLQQTLSFPGWTDLQLLQYTKKVLQVRTPVHPSTYSQSTTVLLTDYRSNDMLLNY